MSTRLRLTRRFLVPSSYSEGEGRLLGYALDILKDTLVQRIYLGLLTRFPETAPDDVLPLMGRMRKVIRGIDEPRDSYVQRLLKWLDDRDTCGNPLALMQKLAEYMGPGCRIRTVDARGNWFTRNTDGTFAWLLNQGNWDWDSALGLDADRFARFWVIIYPPASLWVQDTRTWNGDIPEWSLEEGRSWGSTAAPGQVQTLRQIVRDWKPEGTRCVNIIAAFDPDSFDPSAPEPDGYWGRWCKDNGSGKAIPTRTISSALFWDGVI